jgi:SAM-dependent methyltransferase
MPDSVSKSAAPVADYDSFAAAYSASNESNLFNAYYARPEMIRLAGDVAGLEILDAGCGSGPLMEALRSKDAVVSGFDLSPAMVELARQRLGEDADVRVADLGAPLPYPDDAFDLVVASLSLHYVKDWAAALAELRRVLKPGGRLIGSIIHPTVYAIVYPEADYFALTQYSEDYDFGEGTCRTSSTRSSMRGSASRRSLSRRPRPTPQRNCCPPRTVAHLSASCSSSWKRAEQVRRWL